MYVGYTCNGLNIPQKSFRYTPKNKEKNFVNTAKLGFDFKMQMAKLGLDFKRQMVKLGKQQSDELWNESQKIEIRNEFIAASGEVRKEFITVRVLDMVAD